MAHRRRSDSLDGDTCRGGPNPVIANGNFYRYAGGYYNPTQGRWTQLDSLNSLLDFSNGNRYAYAGDDPTDNVDPSGRNWVSDALDPWGVLSTKPARECAIWGGGTAATTALAASPTGPVDPLIAGGAGAIGCATGAASSLDN